MNRMGAVLICSFLLASSCAEGDRTEQGMAQSPVAQHVLWISIDTLRADYVQAVDNQGPPTPQISQLASQGIVFNNAWSTYPLTFPAHASAFTGLWPPGHGVRENRDFRLSDDLKTVAEVFTEAGWSTGGFVSSAVLRSATGIDSGFSTWSDPAEQEAFHGAQRSGWQTLELANQWLAEQDGNIFQFFHLYEPHTPYEPDPRFKTEKESFYAGEVREADAIVAELIGAWKSMGLYEDALIVLFSDHGEGLGDHLEREHGIFLYREVTRIPLIIKTPGETNQGLRVAWPVSLVDLAKTTVKAAGLTGFEASDGVDLLTSVPAEDRFLYMESFHGTSQYNWAELKGFVHKNYHWIQAPQVEYYNLKEDPAELKNLALTDSVPSIYGYELEAIGQGQMEEVGYSASEIEMLRSLGYVGGLSLSDSVSSGERLDPKLGIHTANQLWDAIEQLKDEQSLAAERQLIESMNALGINNQQLVETVANNLLRAGRAEMAYELMLPLDATGEPPIQQLLAETEYALGKWKAAEARFARILRWNSETPRAWLGLGLIELAKDKPTDALQPLQQAVKLDSTLGEAWIALGAAYAQLSQWEKAKGAWKTSTELDPNDRDAWENLMKLAQITEDQTLHREAREALSRLSSSS